MPLLSLSPLSFLATVVSPPALHVSAQKASSFVWHPAGRSVGHGGGAGEGGGGRIHGGGGDGEGGGGRKQLVSTVGSCEFLLRVQ